MTSRNCGKGFKLFVVFRPGAACFPDSDVVQLDAGTDGAEGVHAFGDMGVEGLACVLVYQTRHVFRCGVLRGEGDDAVTVDFLEGVVHGIVGVHAQGVVELGEEVSHHFLDGFEVKDHVLRVQFFGGEDEFDFAGVTVGELAFVEVFGEEVSAL